MAEGLAEGKHMKSILVNNKSAYEVTLNIFKNWTKSRSLAESIIVDGGDSFLFQKEEVFRFELGARLDGTKMETILSLKMWEKDVMLCISGNLHLKVKAEEMKMEGVDEYNDECDEEANDETRNNTRNTTPFAKSLKDTAGNEGISTTLDNTDCTDASNVIGDDGKHSNYEAEEGKCGKIIENLTPVSMNSKDTANEEKTEGKQLKSILVDNKSAHTVTLCTLKNWTKSRSLAESKIVDRGDSFLFQQEKAFRFELRARLDGKKMVTILSPRIWKKDMMLCISGDRELKVKDEEMNLKEKQICTRRQNMKKEVSASGTKNLYQVLGLNMKEVRMNAFREQNDIIKKAYHSQLRRWHPDKNPEKGDNAICQEIILAYNILKDPNTRAAYNNIVDYDEGGLSKLKALFKPESYHPDRASPFERSWNGKRIGLSFLSFLFVSGGAGLTFLTAGMAAPAIIGVLTASGSVMGGGISSGLRTISRTSIEDGCSFRKYLISLLVGAVGGAAIGAGIAGIAGILGGAANFAFKAAQLSLDRQISQRMVTTAFRGFITSITNNLDAILAGGPKTTWKQFIVHILLDAMLGGIAGVPGGLTENMIEDVVSAEESLAAFESCSSDVRNGVEELTIVAAETFTTVVEERLDDDIENKSIVSHLKYGVKQVAIAVGKYSGIAVVNAAKIASERGQATEMNDESNNQDEYNEIIESATPVVNCPQDNSDFIKASRDSSKESENSNNEEVCCENMDNPTVKCFSQTYISEGSWFSKMLVDYEEGGEKKHQKGQGSGSLIWIPSHATNIKVRFQVMRAPYVWSDVKKYNFADDHWEKPIQPHIFEYNKPVSLTYTLAGKLSQEKVMKVSVECYASIIDNVLPSYDALIAQTNYDDDPLKQNLLFLKEKSSDDGPMKQNLFSREEKTSDDGSMKQNLPSRDEKTSDDGPMRQNLPSCERKTNEDGPTKHNLPSCEGKTNEDGPTKHNLPSRDEKTSDDSSMRHNLPSRDENTSDDGSMRHNLPSREENTSDDGSMRHNLPSRDEKTSEDGPMRHNLLFRDEKTSDDGSMKHNLPSREEKTSDDGSMKHNLPFHEGKMSNNNKLTNPVILKYISKGNWLSSRMLVDYEENGEEKHHVVKGSGNSIPIPNNATNIKVRFQVMRGPGVWSDVKEYDRFKNCWAQPTKPHIFEYDTPVSCTYTLAGKLCFEKVTNTSRDIYTDEQFKLNYIFKGNWYSKMLVDYEENGEEKHHEGYGSGSSILLPSNATNIKVSFQVQRGPGVWSDVKEYDRFKKCWIKPTQPHIFKYDTPVSCTYTLAGKLYHEAVMKVSGDDDIDKRIRLKYFSQENWFSKMLVDYDENGEKKHHKGHGSGSLILLPKNATNIKVRFQVMRSPGIWSDVKEYDRFKKSWIKPTRSHIFEYDTPVSCTYTLAGNLFFEKVQKTSTDDHENDEEEKLKYFYQENWLSKMLVGYNENGEEKHHEGYGSGSSILLPSNATNIRVSFQVQRGPGIWCDVKEYDRFKKCWIKPIQPHIFKYDTPVSCTYTLAGNFCYEAVMKVSGDDDIDERIGLKYISEGSWFSKMLVDYEENGETKHQEVENSESLILIPSKATNIKVRFQVMRGPSVWCDVKKYDRFKKCWIKPTQPHIFEYDTPVSRTYTLAGKLHYEKVMKITGEHFDEISDIDDKTEGHDNSEKSDEKNL